MWRGYSFRLSSATRQPLLTSHTSRLQRLQFFTLMGQISTRCLRSSALLRYFTHRPLYSGINLTRRRWKKRQRYLAFIPSKLKRVHTYRRRYRKLQLAQRKHKFRKAWIRRFTQTLSTSNKVLTGGLFSSRQVSLKNFFRLVKVGKPQEVKLVTRKKRGSRSLFVTKRRRSLFISRRVHRAVVMQQPMGVRQGEKSSLIRGVYRRRNIQYFYRFSGFKSRSMGIARGFNREVPGVGRYVRSKITIIGQVIPTLLKSTYLPAELRRQNFQSSIEWYPAATLTTIQSTFLSYFPAIYFLLSTLSDSSPLPLYLQDKKLPPLLDGRSKDWGTLQYLPVCGGAWSMWRNGAPLYQLNDSLAFSSQLFQVSRNRFINFKSFSNTIRQVVTLPGFLQIWSNWEKHSSIRSPKSIRGKNLYSFALRTSYYRQIIRRLRTQKKVNPAAYSAHQLKWGTLNFYNIDFLRFMQGTLLRVRLGDSARSLHIGYIGPGSWWGGQFNSLRAFTERRVFYEGEEVVAQDYYLGLQTHKFYSAAYTPFLRIAQTSVVGGSTTSGDLLHETVVRSPERGWSVPLLGSDHLGLGRTLALADIRYVQTLFQNPTLMKYLLWTRRDPYQSFSSTIRVSTFLPTLHDVQKFNFSSRVQLFQASNLWPAATFSYTIRRRLLKTFAYRQFSPEMTMWVYYNLVRFMEHYSGRKVYLQFNPFAENGLTFHDLSRCYVWESRLRTFQRLLGAKIFVGESLRIIYLALKSHDPKFLGNWIKEMLYRLSFWKSRLLFRYLKYIMKHFYFPCAEEIGFRGLKLTLRGKISVAGNARTRTLFYAIGDTSNAKMNNRVISYFTTINSFTGVMGFTLLFYF